MPLLDEEGKQELEQALDFAVKMSVEQSKKAIVAMSNDDEFMEATAVIHKKTYDALIKQGFTPDQALSIVVSKVQGTIDALGRGAGDMADKVLT